MLEVPVYDREGKKLSPIEVDESRLGGTLHRGLLRQALIMYHANLRQGTQAAKSKSEKAGSGRKVYRQKHTGRARIGMIRSPHRRGGGRAFGIDPRDWSYGINRKALRLALKVSILGKVRDGEILVIDEIVFPKPRTSEMATLLRNLGVEDSCLVVLDGYDKNVLLSCRNIPRVEVRRASDLNAYDVLRFHRLLLTRKAAGLLLEGSRDAA